MSKLLIIELLQSEDIAAPPSSVEKVMGIDEHIGCAMSGLIADARTLVVSNFCYTVSTFINSCDDCNSFVFQPVLYIYLASIKS